MRIAKIQIAPLPVGKDIPTALSDSGVWGHGVYCTVRLTVVECCTVVDPEVSLALMLTV